MKLTTFLASRTACADFLSFVKEMLPHLSAGWGLWYPAPRFQSAKLKWPLYYLRSGLEWDVIQLEGRLLWVGLFVCTHTYSFIDCSLQNSNSCLLSINVGCYLQPTSLFDNNLSPADNIYLINWQASNFIHVYTCLVLCLYPKNLWDSKPIILYAGLTHNS